MKLYEIFTIVMIFCAGFCSGVTFLGLYISRENKKWMEPLENVYAKIEKTLNVPSATLADCGTRRGKLRDDALAPIQIIRDTWPNE